MIVYRSSAENRRFLHARLLGSEMELDKYRQLVEDAIYPDPLSRHPVRVKKRNDSFATIAKRRLGRGRPDAQFR